MEQLHGKYQVITLPVSGLEKGGIHDEEKEKKVKYTQMLEQVKERLSALS